MIKNKLNQIIIDEQDFIETLYETQDPMHLSVDHIVVNNRSWIQKFKKSSQEYDLPCELNYSLESNLSSEQFIEQNLSDWHLPEEYINFDIENYLLSKCKTDEQRERVQSELKEFEKRNMFVVLKWLKYFVDTMIERQLVWGVGRGSSCASYCLFLLGVHRIDSLKYQLPIDEFLK